MDVTNEKMSISSNMFWKQTREKLKSYRNLYRVYGHLQTVWDRKSENLSDLGQFCKCMHILRILSYPIGSECYKDSRIKSTLASIYGNLAVSQHDIF